MLVQFSFTAILFYMVKSCPAGLPKEDPPIKPFTYLPNGPGPIPYGYTQAPTYFLPQNIYSKEPQSKNYILSKINFKDVLFSNVCNT